MDNWDEWSKYVLKELERQDEFAKVLSDKVDELVQEVAVLKIKASIFGGLAGAILSAILSIIVYYITKGD